MSNPYEEPLNEAIQTNGREILSRKGELQMLAAQMIHDMKRVQTTIVHGELNSCGEIQGRALTFDLLVREIRVLEKAHEKLYWIKRHA